jgi:hypothetical protein
MVNTPHWTIHNNLNYLDKVILPGTSLTVLGVHEDGLPPQCRHSLSQIPTLKVVSDANLIWEE